ncbi:hypothetical protein A6A03_05225 [Chloroflexus islandicus]|uniref:Transposase IS4-like domain-containing protein n=1 Tax=Chloroflexus islandicus TaxID=1707952 RepID=A0A178LTW9_9CHLR|nr:hypothetical protein A6A03_05225 [Chloroflexus islandicus]
MTVATFLALLRTQQVATIEQRWYEWCVEAPRKAGTQRQTLAVTTCFAPLLAWIVRVWHGKQIALALDATTLHDRFVVLTSSVVARGTGIPVAWTVLPAGQSQSWRRAWLRMLRMLRPAIPPDGMVIVLADRGVDARWLVRRIVRLGWHPFLRSNAGAKVRPAGQARWYWLRELVSPDGQPRQDAGTCFKHPASRLPCTLLVWAVGSRTVANDPVPARTGSPMFVSSRNAHTPPRPRATGSPFRTDGIRQLVLAAGGEPMKYLPPKGGKGWGHQPAQRAS